MSFLKGLMGNIGGGMNAGPAAAAQPVHVGGDTGRINSIVDRVGKSMNMIAAGGGAQGGYEAPQVPQMPAINNQMQLLDPKILQALVAHFGGQQR